MTTPEDYTTENCTAMGTAHTTSAAELAAMSNARFAKR